MSATTLPGKDTKTAEKGTQTDCVAIKNEAPPPEPDAGAGLRQVQGELAAVKAKAKAGGKAEQQEEVVRPAEKVEGDTSDEWQPARPKMGGEIRCARANSWNSDDSTSRELMGTDRGNGDFLQ